MAITSVKIALLWHQSLELRGQEIGTEGTLPGIKPSRFAAANASIQAEGELEMFHLGRSSAANGERHSFGEGKAPKKPAHRPETPIPKLPQVDGDSN